MVGLCSRSVEGLQSIISVDVSIFGGRRDCRAGTLVESRRRVIVNRGGVGTETAVQATITLYTVTYLFRTSYNCSMEYCSCRKVLTAPPGYCVRNISQALSVAMYLLFFLSDRDNNHPHFTPCKHLLLQT